MSVRVLVVEDDPALRAGLVRIVGRCCTEIMEAGSVGEARERLVETKPDLVLLDVRLPDGNGVELAEYASTLRPKPTLIAISGHATTPEAFDLGQAGVAHFLPKPFTVAQLLETLEAASHWVPSLEPFVAETVGKRQLLEIVSSVRGTMVDEALAKAEGSRRGAARQLGISRQAVQQMVRKRDRSGHGSDPLDPDSPEEG